MHLLFYGREQEQLLETKRVENLLREQSIKVFYVMLDVHQQL